MNDRMGNRWPRTSILALLGGGLVGGALVWMRMNIQ